MNQHPKNFTTPKQSERLLSLGIPKNSADFSIICTSELPCDWRKYSSNIEEGTEREWYVYRCFLDGKPYLEDEENWNKEKRFGFMLPCWSAGRLIEIYEMAYGKPFKRDINKPLIEDVIGQIDSAINYKPWIYRFFPHFDFSQLDENTLKTKFNILKDE